MMENMKKLWNYLKRNLGACYTVIGTTHSNFKHKLNTDNYDLAYARFRRHYIDQSIKSVELIDNHNNFVVMKR